MTSLFLIVVNIIDAFVSQHEVLANITRWFSKQSRGFSLTLVRVLVWDELCSNFHARIDEIKCRRHTHVLMLV